MEIKYQEPIVETRIVEIQPEKYTLELTPDEFHLLLVLLGSVSGNNEPRADADKLYNKMYLFKKRNMKSDTYKGWFSVDAVSFKQLNKV